MIDIFEIFDKMKKEEDEAKAKRLEADSKEGKENKKPVEDVLSEELEKGLKEEPEKGLKEESED